MNYLKYYIFLIKWKYSILFNHIKSNNLFKYFKLKKLFIFKIN